MHPWPHPTLPPTHLVMAARTCPEFAPWDHAVYEGRPAVPMLIPLDLFSIHLNSLSSATTYTKMFICRIKSEVISK